MINFKQAKKYCCDDISNIENYNIAINDTNETWVCHHKNEILLNKSHAELKKLNLYENRPANELIFLTRGEHIRLHWKYNKTDHALKISKSHIGLTYKQTDEYRKKMSESCKGEKNGMYGKGYLLKGEKNGMFNKHWYTNGKNNICCYECPDGFYPGMTRCK